MDLKRLSDCVTDSRARLCTRCDELVNAIFEIGRHISHLIHLTLTMSLARTINYIRKEGLAKFFRDISYIGDAKSGRLVGTDR